MFSLLQSWPTVAERVRVSRSVALFLDFDGTLAPLVPRPQDATAHPEIRAALRRLAAHSRVKVWIISGRRWHDVRSRLDVAGVLYRGVLGWDTGHNSLGRSTERLVEQTRRQLMERLNGTAGLRVEDKGVAFALHFREAPFESIQIADRILADLLKGTRGGLRAIAGELVWEVLPQEIRGKGYAVAREWHMRSGGALPIYIGNDASDEPAFEALAKGITVRVGPIGPTKAQYFVRNPAEVRQFLKLLERVC